MTPPNPANVPTLAAGQVFPARMSDLPHPTDRLLDHADFLRRLAHHLAGPHAGDDLLQDTWLASQRRAPAHTADVRGWFATVMTNLWRNRARDEGRRRGHEAAVHRGETAASAAHIAACEEVRRRVVAAVLQLPDDLREVVLLRYYEGLDSRAIGARLGLSSSAIRTRLQAALQRLRERLDDEHGGVRAAWAGPLAFWRGSKMAAVATSVRWPMRAAFAFAGACAATWLCWTVLSPAAPPRQVAPTAERPSGVAAAPVAAAEPPPAAPVRVAVPAAALPRAATTEQRPLATLSGVVVRLGDGTPLPDLTIVA